LERRIVPFSVPSTPFAKWLPSFRSPVKRSSVQSIRALVDHVINDAGVMGIVVHMPQFHAGWATLTGLKRQFERLRQAKKRVVIWLPEGGGNRELYLCGAADEVLISPQAGFGPLGLVASVRYLRPVLDRLGVELHVEARHEFKTAMEPYLRDSMSDAQREQTDALLGAFDDQLRQAMASRGIDPDAAFSEGMISGQAAVDAGFADGLAYEDELGPRYLADEKQSFSDALQRLGLYGWRPWRPLRRPRYVAVIDVRGAIVQSKSSTAARGVVDAESITRKVRRIRKDKRAVGAVLAVNSPGGSALASDLIHREVMSLAAEKPVVAWFGDVAASGGYYIAASAASIFCEATTITGSIGVIMARPTVEAAFNKVGIVTERVRKSPHGDMLSASRALDEEEKRILEREADAYYRSFVDIVAAGRSRSFDDIEPLARGRVWSGIDAQNHGLVDAEGGLESAIADVRKRANLAPDDAKVPGLVVTTPKERIAPPWPSDASAAAHQVVADVLGMGEFLPMLQSNERHWFMAPNLPGVE
jgi:protease-4